MTLFAMPFAAVGIGMTWWCAHIVSQHATVQSWVEVPAMIKSAKLVESHDDATTYRAVAEYDYEFGGKKYTGQRVGIHGGSDNIGDFQRDAYQELKRHLDQRQPFRCYVDPNKPSESVLYRDLRGEMLGFYTLFATLFGSIGLGLISGTIAAARRTPKPAVAEVPSDQPWLMRTDWAAGQIRSNDGSLAMPAVAVVAVYWTFASLPLVWKLPEILQRPNARWQWLYLAFPAIGAVLLGVLIRQIIQARKYGTSVLQLASTPGIIGGQLAGVVRIPKPVNATEGFFLKLSCLDWVSDGDGRQEKILWQDERLVMTPMRDDVEGAVALPVLFAIPFECAETPRPGEKSDVHWQLDASADVPGVDYQSKFDVPVFKTSESRPDFKLDQTLTASYSSKADNDIVLRRAGIVKESLPNGTRLVFPMARNPLTASILTAFLIVWSSATCAMHASAPILMTIVFGLFGLIPLFLALDFWLYRSVVDASVAELVGRGGWLGIGRQWRIAAVDIREFATKQSMSAGANMWNTIVVETNNGTKRTIGRRVPGKLAQQAVIDELTAALHSTAAANSP